MSFQPTKSVFGGGDDLGSSSSTSSPPTQNIFAQALAENIMAQQPKESTQNPQQTTSTNLFQNRASQPGSNLTFSVETNKSRRVLTDQARARASMSIQHTVSNFADSTPSQGQPGLFGRFGPGGGGAFPGFGTTTSVFGAKHSGSEQKSGIFPASRSETSADSHSTHSISSHQPQPLFGRKFRGAPDPEKSAPPKPDFGAHLNYGGDSKFCTSSTKPQLGKRRIELNKNPSFAEQLQDYQDLDAPVQPATPSGFKFAAPFSVGGAEMEGRSDLHSESDSRRRHRDENLEIDTRPPLRGNQSESKPKSLVSPGLASRLIKRLGRGVGTAASRAPPPSKPVSSVGVPRTSTSARTPFTARATASSGSTTAAATPGAKPVRRRSSGGPTSPPAVDPKLFATLKTLKLVAVPKSLNNSNFMNRHFGCYGRIVKVMPRMKLNETVIEFNTHESAKHAKQKGSVLKPGTAPVKIAWVVPAGFPAQYQISRSQQDPRKPSRPSPVSAASNVESRGGRQPLVPAATVSHQTRRPQDVPTTPSGTRPVAALSRQQIGRVKESDVLSAAKLWGSCGDMCPEKERYQREVQKRLSSYELDKDGKVDPTITIKDYSRSSADQEEPLPHELRPGTVLVMTMDYLIGNVAFAPPTDEAKIPIWYDFLWNRTRAIRKDLTQQMLSDPVAVGLVEKCTRFHIFASHHLCEFERGDFEPKMNTENLTKCLQSLRHLYEDFGKAGEESPNEAEFRAYDIILNLNEPDILRQVMTYKQSVRLSTQVRLALKLFTAVQNNNYVLFFRLVREKTDFLQSSLAHRYFPQMRLKALETIHGAYKNNSWYPIDDLMHILGFEDPMGVLEFCQYYGTTNPSDSGSHVCLSRTMFRTPETPFPPPKKSQWLVDIKSQGYALGEDISSVSELTSDFEVDIMYSEIWTDPRLSFENENLPSCILNITLKTEFSSFLGSETYSEMRTRFRQKIWTPDTCIVNSKVSMIHQSPSPNIFAIVYRNGRVWTNYRMKVKGPCRLDMKMFPFDLIKCNLLFESYSFNAAEVKLHWDVVPMTFMNPIDLPEFQMVGWRADARSLSYPNAIWDQLELTFVFRRRKGSYLFQAYFPTCLTVLSAWVGLLLDARTISARTTLGISSLLAMVLQFGTILRQLPRVSYIKCLDVWMIACVVCIFMALVELALVYQLSLRERSKELASQILNGGSVSSVSLPQPVCSFDPRGYYTLDPVIQPYLEDAPPSAPDQPPTAAYSDAHTASESAIPVLHQFQPTATATFTLPSRNNDEAIIKIVQQDVANQVYAEVLRERVKSISKVEIVADLIRKKLSDDILSKSIAENAQIAHRRAKEDLKLRKQRESQEFMRQTTSSIGETITNQTLKSLLTEICNREILTAKRKKRIRDTEKITEITARETLDDIIEEGIEDFYLAFYDTQVVDVLEKLREIKSRLDLIWLGSFFQKWFKATRKRVQRRNILKEFPAHPSRSNLAEIAEGMSVKHASPTYCKTAYSKNLDCEIAFHQQRVQNWVENSWEWSVERDFGADAVEKLKKIQIKRNVELQKDCFARWLQWSRQMKYRRELAVNFPVSPLGDVQLSVDALGPAPHKRSRFSTPDPYWSSPHLFSLKRKTSAQNVSSSSSYQTPLSSLPKRDSRTRNSVDNVAETQQQQQQQHQQSELPTPEMEKIKVRGNKKEAKIERMMNRLQADLALELREISADERRYQELIDGF